MGIETSSAWNDWNVIEEATDYKKPGPGGYIAKITSVYDNCRGIRVSDPNDKSQYLVLELDIAYGEFKDYYQNLNNSFGFWGLSTRLYYTKKSEGMLKRNMAAIEKSNNNYTFDAHNLQALIGKNVGVVLNYYYKQDGTLSSGLEVVSLEPIETIRKKTYKLGEPRRRNQSAASSSSSYDTRSFEQFNDSAISDDIQF